MKKKEATIFSETIHCLEEFITLLTPDEQVWDMALEIYEGLKNKDKDRIKSVFSENQLMNHSRKIDRKIDEVYEFIE